MMSHELRTPLNAIGGFTELLELGLRGPVTREQVEDLGRIRRNKDLLLSIITDILEFARADAGALSVKSEPVSVADLLADLTDLVGSQMQAKGVRFIVGPVPADAIVRADRERAQQVLLNLLSNATKFTEAGGEIAIETTTGSARGAHRRPRYRARNQPRTARIHLRAVRAGGRVADPPHGWHRPRARHRAKAHGGDGRHARRGECAGLGLDVHAQAAPRRRIRRARRSGRSPRSGTNDSPPDSHALRALAIFRIDHVMERRT